MKILIDNVCSYRDTIIQICSYRDYLDILPILEQSSNLMPYISGHLNADIIELVRENWTIPNTFVSGLGSRET